MGVRLGLYLGLVLLVSACGDHDVADSIALEATSHSLQQPDTELVVKGALLSTQFHSFEELKQVVEISYHEIYNHHLDLHDRTPVVYVRHQSNGKIVESQLKASISERDFADAQEGGWTAKVLLGGSSWYAVSIRNSLKKVHDLSRKKRIEYGESDQAFFNLAEKMLCHIYARDVAKYPAEHFTEKGLLNSFNHITAQALMTSIFSENIADFIADLHERKNLPELIRGDFSPEQIEDLENGPVDNYVDIINNEWGQELGKSLKKKYRITSSTIWTEQLLAMYLNDVQNYFSWAFQLSFHPFFPSDEIIITFSRKINKVMQG